MDSGKGHREAIGSTARIGVRRGLPSGGTVNLPGGGVEISTSSPVFIASPATAKIDAVTVGHSSGDGSLNVKYDPTVLGVAGLSELFNAGSMLVGMRRQGLRVHRGDDTVDASAARRNACHRGRENGALTVGETAEGTVELGGPHGAAAIVGACTIGGKMGGNGTLSLDNASWLQWIP